MGSNQAKNHALMHQIGRSFTIAIFYLIQMNEQITIEGVKSYSTPPRGSAWEPFLSLGRSQAEGHPHSDGGPQPLSRSVSSSSLGTMPQDKHHEANHDQIRW